MYACAETYPHMLAEERAQFNDRFSDLTDMIVHYNMLFSAVAGCVQCVKHYADNGGEVWRGSQNAPGCNSWRASFTSQTLEVLPDQAAVHEYLKDLPGADGKIITAQQGWGKNKLLQTARELGEQLRGRVSEGSVRPGEPASASSCLGAERKKRSSAEDLCEDTTHRTDQLRKKRLQRLHDASDEGRSCGKCS